MVKIRYLKRTHDSAPGKIRYVNAKCANVLVLLRFAEYVDSESAIDEPPIEKNQSNINAPKGGKSKKNPDENKPQETKTLKETG